MQDFGLNDLLWALGSILCVSIIGMLWTQRESIGAIVSGHWRESLARARTQKAQRDALYGYATVNDYQESTPRVMSRSEARPSLSSPSSLQTDSFQTDRQLAQAQPGRAELLTLYQTMRAAGIGRERARPVLKAVGLPLDNNLWAEAVPVQPSSDDAEYRTPIVGRPTSAKFETDPDFPYQSPA
jgi:hypothetical protein